jgi:hypothetical protein
MMMMQPSVTMAYSAIAPPWCFTIVSVTESQPSFFAAKSIQIFDFSEDIDVPFFSSYLEQVCGRQPVLTRTSWHFCLNRENHVAWCNRQVWELAKFFIRPPAYRDFVGDLSRWKMSHVHNGYLPNENEAVIYRSNAAWFNPQIRALQDSSLPNLYTSGQHQNSGNNTQDCCISRDCIRKQEIHKPPMLLYLLLFLVTFVGGLLLLRWGGYFR